jgi:hypothetical protein
VRLQGLYYHEIYSQSPERSTCQHLLDLNRNCPPCAAQQSPLQEAVASVRLQGLYYHEILSVPQHSICHNCPSSCCTMQTPAGGRDQCAAAALVLPRAARQPHPPPLNTQPAAEMACLLLHYGLFWLQEVVVSVRL